jgi:hypothetical protein
VLKSTATQHSADSSTAQQHLGKEDLQRCISTGSDERQQWRLVAERGQASGLHGLSVQSLALEIRNALESQCSPWHSQQRSRHKAHAQLQPDRTALVTAGG